MAPFILVRDLAGKRHLINALHIVEITASEKHQGSVIRFTAGNRSEIETDTSFTSIVTDLPAYVKFTTATGR